jgi:hypothetical protein
MELLAFEFPKEAIFYVFNTIYVSLVGITCVNCQLFETSKIGIKIKTYICFAMVGVYSL